jgi:hypothetical protein
MEYKMADEEKTAAIKKRRKAQSIKDGYPDWPETDYKYRSDMSLGEMAAAFPKDMYAHGKAAIKGIREGVKEVTGYAEGGKTGMRGQVKKDEKTGQKKRIKKGTEEYGRSRMEGLKSVSPDDIKTVYPAGKPKQDVFFAYGPDHPKAKSALAPKTSPRPKPRPKSMEEDDYGAVDRGNRAAQLEGFNYGGKVSKMSMGGKARGMGAATKGGSFSKNG